jgi:flagellar L-ring protein precursor FlgH
MNVGDIVTIGITESSKAGNQATTKASKTSGVKVGIASLFGLSMPNMKMFNDNQVGLENAIEGSVGNTSSGEGKTTRETTFTTYISAQVIQVLPNRNLVIQGRRHIKINNETEVVTIRGIIRPEDLDRTNTVPSTAVADARLEVSGYGVVSDKQRQGWLTRILDHVWPW